MTLRTFIDTYTPDLNSKGIYLLLLQVGTSINYNLTFTFSKTHFDTFIKDDKEFSLRVLLHNDSEYEYKNRTIYIYHHAYKNITHYRDTFVEDSTLDNYVECINKTMEENRIQLLSSNMKENYIL